MESENKELNVKDLKELKEKLSALKEMLDEGLLTKEEFDEKRNQIMGKKANPVMDIVNEVVGGRPKVRKCPNCGED